MARRGNPLKPLLALAILVVAGMVGWTWYQTGELGLWPGEVSSHDAQLRTLKKQLRANEKRIGALNNQLTMGMRNVPRDSIEQEIADLEEENRQLRRRIERLER